MTIVVCGVDGTGPLIIYGPGDAVTARSAAAGTRATAAGPMLHTGTLPQKGRMPMNMR